VSWLLPISCASLSVENGTRFGVTRDEDMAVTTQGDIKLGSSSETSRRINGLGRWFEARTCFVPGPRFLERFSKFWRFDLGLNRWPEAPLFLGQEGNLR